MHPVLFEFFGIPISPYGLLIASGMLVGVVIARRRARRLGIPEDAVMDVVFWGAIAGFLGARLAFVLINFDDFLRQPMPYLLSRQGFVYLGGLLAAIPVVFLVLRRWKVRFWPMADLLAPPLALAHAFGRAGCFCAGCCYGAPTDLPWGVSFPRFIRWEGAPVPLESAAISPGGAILDGDRVIGHVDGSPAFLDQAYDVTCPIGWTDSHSLPLHPTQLYDVGLQLLIFGALTLLWHRRRFHGQVFLLYLWLYSATRIALEFFRGDPGRELWLGDRVSTSQLISGVIIIAALVMTVQARRLFPRRDAPVMNEPEPAET